MSIFERFSRLFRSNVNDLITRAEDPEKMLAVLLEDMTRQLAVAKAQVASAIADENRVKAQADGEAALAAEWEQRAMLAVEQGRDDLATTALTRQAEHAGYAATIRATWETQRAATEQLKDGLRQLSDKLEEARRKKNLLMARQRRTEAQRQIAETMSSVNQRSAFDAFTRIEERIDASERQLSAAQETEEEFTGDALAREFTALERSAGGHDAESRLLALKQRMGALPAATGAPLRALAAGAPEAVRLVDPAADQAQLARLSRPNPQGMDEAELSAEVEQATPSQGRRL